LEPLSKIYPSGGRLLDLAPLARPRVNLINFLGVNLLNLFCKLDHFTSANISFSVIFKDLAYKKERKFTPNKLYETDMACEGQTRYSSFVLCVSNKEKSLITSTPGQRHC
jgi:hypothetical protein